MSYNPYLKNMSEDLVDIKSLLTEIKELMIFAQSSKANDEDNIPLHPMVVFKRAFIKCKGINSLAFMNDDTIAEQGKDFAKNFIISYLSGCCSHDYEGLDLICNNLEFITGYAYSFWKNLYDNYFNHFRSYEVIDEI